MLTFLKKIFGRSTPKEETPRATKRARTVSVPMSRREAVKLKQKRLAEFWREMFYLKNILPKEEKAEKNRLKRELVN